MITNPLRNEGRKRIGKRTQNSQSGETPPHSQYKDGQARGCGLNRAISHRKNYLSEHGVHREFFKNRGTP